MSRPAVRPAGLALWQSLGSHWGLAIVGGVALIPIIWLGPRILPGPFEISGTIMSTSVTVTLDRAAAGQGVAAAAQHGTAVAFIEGATCIVPASTVDCPAAGVATHAVRMQALDGIAVTDLAVAAAGTLTVRAAPAAVGGVAGAGYELQLFAEAAPASFELELQRPQLLALGGTLVSVSGSEPLRVRAIQAGHTHVPLRLLLTGAGGFVLDRLPTSRLRFGVESRVTEASADQPQQFHSSITSATISYRTAHGDEHVKQLAAGSALLTEDFTGQVTHIAADSQGVHTVFAGRGSKLVVGPPGEETDLTPDWIDRLGSDGFVAAALSLITLALVFVQTVYAHFAYHHQRHGEPHGSGSPAGARRRDNDDAGM